MRLEWNVTPKHVSEKLESGNHRHVVFANFGVSDGGTCEPEGVYIATETYKPLSPAEEAVYNAVLCQFSAALAEKVVELANKALANRPPALSIKDKDGNVLLETR